MPEQTTSALPSGMLTVMFTDVEGSTTHWERHPGEMRDAMVVHDELLLATTADYGGFMFKHTGDGMGFVFTSPDRAALAAVDVQRKLQARTWGVLDRLKVRIGLHMGDIEPTGDDYFGPAINRAARIMDIANGDQIAASGVVADFVTSVATRRMGAHQLKGIGTEMIEIVSAPDLVLDERPLRARVSRAVKPLPAPAHRLLGRDDEVARTSALMSHHQYVTLLGPGGVGKTHLALEVGRILQNRFADGAVFVELAPVSDPSAALEQIAESIGARMQPEMSLLESILNFLEDREMLIVLDNCEHLIESVNEFVELTAPFNDVRLLATSRERLGLRSEQVFVIEPLPVDGAAVELFLERARERDLDFDPDEDAMAAIAEICARLDGMPLAVELAAAWVRVLTPQQLQERLADRFAVLDRTRNRGHRQTLRETVQWSHDQLDAQQKQLFDRLSIFAGSFSFEAAIEVCGDDDVDSAEMLDTLMSLVDKSMISTDRGVGEIRFTMLETLRQFGTEQLGERNERQTFEQAHARFFRELAQHQARQLISSKEAEVWDQLDREWANIRTAFNTLMSGGHHEEASELVLDLGWFGGMSLRTELLAWLNELHALPRFDLLSNAGSIMGLLAIYQYFTIDAASVANANRGLAYDFNDPYGFCRTALAAESLNNAHIAEDSDARTTAWLDSLTPESPTTSRMWALGMRVFHICSHAPSPVAAELHAEMAQLAASSDSATAQALTRWAGGMVRSFESIDSALEEWQYGLDAARSVSDVHLLVHLIVGLELHFTAAHGDLDTVLSRCLTTLQQARDQHYLAGTSHLFGVTAIILARVDRAETGAQLLGSMVANGHMPRGNARRAIQMALGDKAAEAEERGKHLTTNAAAALACQELLAAIDERAADDPEDHDG